LSSRPIALALIHPVLDELLGPTFSPSFSYSDAMSIPSSIFSLICIHFSLLNGIPPAMEFESR
ncbi:hypothetical protein, partial [Symmachiella dynata]|uniref:hypothetical protein n=1 Tax=Symmachiella dynata TaxID=2527995 RepID=UPI0030EBB655